MPCCQHFVAHFFRKYHEQACPSCAVRQLPEPHGEHACTLHKQKEHILNRSNSGYALFPEKVAERKGLEPSASGVTVRRYNRLNYRSAMRWWAVQDLNLRPPPCEGDALPAELTAQRKNLYYSELASSVNTSSATSAIFGGDSLKIWSLPAVIDWLTRQARRAGELPPCLPRGADVRLSASPSHWASWPFDKILQRESCLHRSKTLIFLKYYPNTCRNFLLKKCYRGHIRVCSFSS